MFMTLLCKMLSTCVRLLAEIEPLEALDVFGMMKESTFKVLEEVFTDRKVGCCYHVAQAYCLK